MLAERDALPQAQRLVASGSVPSMNTNRLGVSGLSNRLIVAQALREERILVEALPTGCARALACKTQNGQGRRSHEPNPDCAWAAVSHAPGDAFRSAIAESRCGRNDRSSGTPRCPGRSNPVRGVLRRLVARPTRTSAHIVAQTLQQTVSFPSAPTLAPSVGDADRAAASPTTHCTRSSLA